MANTRIKDLPRVTNTSAGDTAVIDGALGSRSIELPDLMNSVRPFATQAEAEAGTDETKDMNPLRTKQAIVDIGDDRYATKTQGGKADTAVQPEELSDVATSGEYGDLNGLPTLGTSAALGFQSAADGGSDSADDVLLTPARALQIAQDIAQGTAVLNVQSAFKSDTFALATAATWTDIPGLSVTITPTNNTRKILLLASLSVSHSVPARVSFRLVRDATPIGVADAAGSRGQAAQSILPPSSDMTSVQIAFHDSPASGSAQTYKMQMLCQVATGYINRSSGDNDAVSSFRGASSLIAMEA